MKGYKRIFLLVLFCFFSLSKQDDVKNWTMDNNSIDVNYYKSKLTEKQRDDYYAWIGVRNSFVFSGNLNQLEKLTKYFTPEKDGYYSRLGWYGLPCYICAIIIIIIIFVYLIRSRFFKGCRGPKNPDNAFIKGTYFVLISGFVIGFLGMIFTLYHAAVSK